MPDIKEKLVELLSCFASVGRVEERKIFPHCYVTDIADHLIANGVTIQEWISVEERLPDEGEDVLAFGYWHEKYQPLMCYLSPHCKGRWFTSVAGQEVYTVTHWMPLPEPPKGE